MEPLCPQNPLHELGLQVPRVWDLGGKLEKEMSIQGKKGSF